jgi:hypothetical protein
MQKSMKNLKRIIDFMFSVKLNIDNFSGSIAIP